MIKNNVLIGKDGWLFLYQGGQKQFDYLRGIEKVNNVSINNFISNITSRQKYFNDKDIKYKHVVFPSKPIVKNLNLPEDYNEIISLFLNYYSNKLINESVIYPLENLKEMEISHATFQKFNTHNTNYGYLEIVNTILKSLFMKPINENNFSVFKKYVGGDLCNMLGSKDVNEEEFIDLNIAEKYIISNKSFLPGNTNEVTILHNEKALTKKRLIIFGDSFFKGTLKFFQLCFYDILYVRSTFIHKDIIENFLPDIVLTGNAERYLSYVVSDTRANNFLFDLYGKTTYKPNNEYIDALRACMSFKNYNHIYQTWISIINNNAYVNKITINSDSTNIDILSAVSLYFEKEGNIEIAYGFIDEILRLNPNNIELQKKLQIYKESI